VKCYDKLIVFDAESFVDDMSYWFECLLAGLAHGVDSLTSQDFVYL